MGVWLDRTVPAAGFVTALLATRALVAALPVAAQTVWLGWSSTSVANLGDHAAAALVASAFVGTDGVRDWCLLALAGLLTTAWRFGAWRTVAIVTTAHVVATYLSEGLVGARVLAGALPRDQLFLLDIGPSYVVAAALTAGLVYGPLAGRLCCAAGLALALPGMLSGITALDMTALGHACAMVIAVAAGWPLRPTRRNPVPRVAPDQPRVASSSRGHGA